MERKTFKQSWETAGSSSSKFSNYFEIYDELFGHLKGSSCTFIEIGIQGGGSLLAWKDYFGPKSRVIGIDVNPACKMLEQPGIEIIIGDTGNFNFMVETFKSIGSISAILDDGGHHFLQQINLVRAAGSAIEGNLIIAIEDTSTSFYKDFLKSNKKNFLNYVKDLTDFFHLDFFKIYPGRAINTVKYPAEIWYSRIFSIKFYAGIVGIHMTNTRDKIEMVTRGVADASLYNFEFEGTRKANIAWPNINRSENILLKISKQNFVNKKIENLVREVHNNYILNRKRSK